MALSFGWEELWAFHESLESPEHKKHLEEEVIGDGWLYRQTVTKQVEVLRFAPKEFSQSIAQSLKPEACIKLRVNPYMKG